MRKHNQHTQLFINHLKHKKMSEITSKTPRLSELTPTSNEGVYQAVLRCEVGTTGGNNLISMTLGAQARPRVVWHPVTPAWLEAFGYTFDPVTLDVPGDELWNEHTEKVVDNEDTKTLPDAMPEIGLFVKESFTAHTWEDKKTGQTMSRAPKMNPTTKAVVCNQGRPIYRETYALPLYTIDDDGVMVSNPLANDVTISSDGTAPKTAESVVEELSQVLMD